MDIEELKYYYAFNRTGLIGPVHFDQAIRNFGSAKDAWKADTRKFQKLGWSERLLKKIEEIKSTVNLERELVRLKDLEVTFLTYQDEKYPIPLKDITDRPFLLYVRGKITKADGKAIAVVGSRRMTAYGKYITHSIVAELCEAGLTIVSGLALGTDAQVHKAALDANGRTIAILGSGIDKILPQTNRFLGEKIVASGQGAIISEFPPGTDAYPSNFPFRNRLISGLSLGVLVIEASEKSGTMLTVGHALDQGRDVFAVPGSVLSILSRGPHKLIKMGAKLVEKAEDILEELELKVEKQKREVSEIFPDSKEEELILKALGADSLHIDTLIRTSGLTTSVVSSTLTLMEMSGKVRNLGGGRYCTG